MKLYNIYTNRPVRELVCLIKIEIRKMNLPCAYAFGVERDDLILDACNVLLMLLHDKGLELAHPVSENGNLLLALLAYDAFLLLPLRLLGVILALSLCFS